MARSLKPDSKLNGIEVADKLKQEEEEESFSYAMQLTMSTVLSMALQSTIELGVFDVIANAGEGAKLSAKDIVAQLPTKNPEETCKMLDRLLGMLATHSLLHCSAIVDDQHGHGSCQRLYSLAPAAKFFVREDGVSLGPLLTLIQHKVFMETWSQLKDAILEGDRAFNRVHGMHQFEYLGVDSGFNHLFNKALIQHTTIVMKKVLECYKGFEHLNTVVDVGGGHGANLSLITSKYPHIKGINFDLPHVIEDAPSYPGVEHVAGDMFESVPKGDAIFMKWILHDWSDEHCLKLLKNCYNATPAGGKVIALEEGVSAMPDTSAATKTNYLVDIFMMAQDPGGKERSRQQFMELATAAGFSGVTYMCYARNFWVIEFFK